MALFFALRLQDFKDEVLLAHTAGTGQIQGPCDLGQLGDVLFFQFSNGHSISPGTRALERIRWCQRVIFKREGDSGKTHVLPGRKAGLVKQPAVVPQQSSLVPTKFLAAPSLRSGPIRRSWFPGFGCWAGGTYAWPWRQADTAYTDCVESVKHQTHDQSACAFYLLTL